MSALDLKFLTHNLSQQLSGCVLNNIQDITVKQYVFKFGRANQKENLMIESGNRMFLVDSVEEPRDKPNKLTKVIRKHVKSLFLDSIEQVGLERVVKMRFRGADKENKNFIFFIYLEFYAKGNIILTDADNVILACLRDHEYSETEKVKLKEVYPLHKAAQIYWKDLSIDQ